MVLHEKYAKEPWRHIGLKVPHHGPPPPRQQTKMSGTISPRDRLQLWVNTFLLKQKENSGSVTATFRDEHPLNSRGANL